MGNGNKPVHPLRLTAAPGFSWVTILDTSSFSPVCRLVTIAVEYRQMKLFPFLLFWAPTAVSVWPPVPENCMEPMDSLAHWPVISTSMEALMDTMLSLRPMAQGSFV